MRDQPNVITRRCALRRSAAFGLGTTISWAAAPPARAQARLAKDAVQYVDQGQVPGRDCDDCLHYIAPAQAGASASCRIVEGPVNPHGHCLAFTPRGQG